MSGSFSALASHSKDIINSNDIDNYSATKVPIFVNQVHALEAVSDIAKLMNSSNDKKANGMVEIIVSEYLGIFKVDQWNSEIDWSGITIVQNHKLIDLDRIPAQVAEFSKTNTRKSKLFDQNKDTYKNIMDFGTSSMRMLNNKPAVDIYGQDVVLCRLVPNDNAYYYEMSSLEARKVTRALHLGENKESACLNEFFLKSYWAKRRSDFISENNVRLSPKGNR